MIEKKSTILFFLVIVFSILWSSAFIAGSIALKDYDSFTLLSLRFIVSAVFLVPILKLLNINIINKQVVGYGFLLGILNNAIYLGFSFCALELVRAQVVIVIISCAPIVTSFLSAWRGVEALSLKKIVGGFLGLIGVIVITGVKKEAASNVFGVFLAATGMFAFSFGTVVFREKVQNLSILQLNFWQAISGALALLPMAIFFGQPLKVPTVATVFSIAYLVFFVTIGGMSLWLFLIKNSGASTASSYHLLNPFFGSLLSYFFLNDPLNLNDFVGALFIAIGLFISSFYQRRK